MSNYDKEIQHKLRQAKRQRPTTIKYMNHLKTIILKDRENRISNPMYEKFENEETSITAINNWMNFEGHSMKDRYELLKQDFTHLVNSK